MSAVIPHLDRLKGWLAHAFALSAPDDAITAEEAALADRLAHFVVNRKMAAPALMALESGRPLNFMGSQVLTFLSPFVTLVFKGVEYERFTRFLEKRESIPFLIDRIAQMEQSTNA